MRTRRSQRGGCSSRPRPRSGAWLYRLTLLTKQQSATVRNEPERPQPNCGNVPARSGPGILAGANTLPLMPGAVPAIGCRDEWADLRPCVTPKLTGVPRPGKREVGKGLLQPVADVPADGRRQRFERQSPHVGIAQFQ